MNAGNMKGRLMRGLTKRRHVLKEKERTFLGRDFNDGM